MWGRNSSSGRDAKKTFRRRIRRMERTLCEHESFEEGFEKLRAESFAERRMGRDVYYVDLAYQDEAEYSFEIDSSRYNSFWEDFDRVERERNTIRLLTEHFKGRADAMEEWIAWAESISSHVFLQWVDGEIDNSSENLFGDIDEEVWTGEYEDFCDSQQEFVETELVCSLGEEKLPTLEQWRNRKCC